MRSPPAGLVESGTVVGAAIGGTVVGLGGSELGSYVGDTAKGVVGDTAGAIAGGIKAAKFW